MDLLTELRESTASADSKEELVSDFETQVEGWHRNFEIYLKPWMPDVQPRSVAVGILDDDDAMDAVGTLISCTPTIKILMPV